MNYKELNTFGLRSKPNYLSILKICRYKKKAKLFEKNNKFKYYITSELNNCGKVNFMILNCNNLKEVKEKLKILIK